VLFTGALFLPYVAVVMANATDQRDDVFDLPPGPNTRPQLDPGHDSDAM